MAVELEGQIINNRYRVDKFLGRGGMAEVYKVWDKKRATPLAMKVLHADLAEDTVFVRRFKREAQTLSSLQHPHIVRFYGFEQVKESAMILMEYIDGSTLRNEIARANKPLPLERVVEIIAPVASALHYAHQLGMVHCDIKPANIMLKQNGEVLLSDFGIARLTEGATATMVGAGTPAYMAPEQILGKDPTPQTDIYALGLVIYEMLAGGERPFTGEHSRSTGSTGEKVRWEQVHLAPPPLRKINPKVSPSVEAVVMHCLAKEPEERYGSVEFVITALQKCLGGKAKTNEKDEFIHDTGKPKPTHPGRESTANKTYVKPQVSGNRNSSGNLFLMILAGIAVLSVVIVGGWYLINQGGFDTRLPVLAVEAEKTEAPLTLPSNTEMVLPTATQTAAPNYVGGGTGEIAFISKQGTDKGFYITDITGRRPKLLSGQLIVGEDLVFSPDGSNIAYVSSQDYIREIYVMNADGSNQTRLTNNNSIDRNPEWSPDGTQIVFTARRDGNREIYVMNADGSNQTRLTQNTADDFWPSWSPDGKEIVYTNFYGSNYDIFVMDADGSHPTRLTTTTAVDENPKWSPDGTRILFVSNRSGNYEIYVMDADGSNVVNLTNNPAIEGDPSWSPDGTLICFYSYRDGNQEIYMMNADGSNQIRLTTNLDLDFSPVWVR